MGPAVLLAFLFVSPAGAAEKDSPYIQKMRADSERLIAETRDLAGLLETLKSRTLAGESPSGLRKERQRLRKELDDRMTRLFEIGQDLGRFKQQEVMKMGSRVAAAILSERDVPAERLFGGAIELDRLMTRLDHHGVEMGVFMKGEELAWSAALDRHARRVRIAWAGGACAALVLLWLLAPRPRRRAAPAVPAAAPCPAAVGGALPAPEPDSLAPGTILGRRFQVVREIGRGSMGRVWEVADAQAGRPAALKRLREELHRSEREIQSLAAESRRVAALRHPGLPEFRSVFFDDGGRICLVCELVQGRSLAQILDLGEKLPGETIKSILAQAAAAVDHAHREGVLHGDIKPSNILVAPDGAVKVLDFSLALLAKKALAKRASQEAAGSPAYAAPEAELGDARRESDVFSLGVVLYEMLTGRLPFEGPNFLEQKREMHFKPPSQAAQDVPAAWDAVVSRALQADPGRRYSCARELSSQAACASC